MGKPEPIAPAGKAHSHEEDELAPGCARPAYNQYRLNQPHDRRAQAVART